MYSRLTSCSFIDRAIFLISSLTIYFFVIILTYTSSRFNNMNSLARSSYSLFYSKFSQHLLELFLNLVEVYRKKFQNFPAEFFQILTQFAKNFTKIFYRNCCNIIPN